ncbi:hypothetical protein OG948_21360 [Embleya sp. NBC_00888]|uniref:hypothetical protein n=1 Tax=Embleya sp. NBC_00888 TaxID=2975960 RepID=UPI00386AF743|nr:hypothetical protein OG948_21360 [Embleya sp. NBC_00888]
MHREGILALLDFAAELDPRVARLMADETTAVETIQSWSRALHDVPAAHEAVGWMAGFAVRAYYEANDQARFWAITPAAILAAWAPKRRALLERHTDPLPPVDPDDEAAYRAHLAASRGAVVAGHADPTPNREIDGQWPSLAQLAAARPADGCRAELTAAGAPTPVRSRFPELSIACPYEGCRAAAGDQCRSTVSRTRLANGTHRSRQEAYAATLTTIGATG